ncbi:MAG: STAS domain-containing protein [Alphaproteobacteria bacterium]|nr:STAS domain-containing protein [Alphaproteobacteria bacterium]
MKTAHALASDFPEPGIMEISRYLDSASAREVEEDVSLCIQSGAREMVLDCAKLHYITGAGMRAILAMARDMQAVEGKLAVCNLQPQVREMFEACGYDKIIPIYGDRDEAVARIAA